MLVAYVYSSQNYIFLPDHTGYMNISDAHPQPGHTQPHPCLHHLNALPITRDIDLYCLAPARGSLQELWTVEQR